MTTLGDIGAGSALGRYELLAPIAQGGMAMVWAARLKGTRGFQKIVAVKSMLPALSDDPQFEEMFLAEAELASRIRHPNVCEILDLGEQDGTLYIVMEWVNGEPLSALQKAARAGGGVPHSVAVRIVRDAAQGLHAAHEIRNDDGELVGLVHRDVSPQNILVTYDGVVKIVDFGVAKATAGDDGKTQAGQVKGKVPYMSPEQTAGKAVDRRTDIFALSIVLYQLVTGKHPFRMDNDMATLRRICDRAPVARASTLVEKLPQSLDDVLATGLEKDATKRFETMAEFGRALDKVLPELATRGEESDIGVFVKGVLGERAEKRKRTIKEAIRVADERLQERATNSASGIVVLERTNPTGVSDVSNLSQLSQLSLQNLSGTSSAVSTVTGPHLPATSHGASSPAIVMADAAVRAPRPRGRSILVAAGLVGVVALGVVGGVVLLRKTPDSPDARAQTLEPADEPSRPETTSPQIATSTPAVATAPPPVELPPATSAEAEASPVDSAVASASAAPSVSAPPKTAMGKLPLKPPNVPPKKPIDPGGSNVPQVTDPGF